MNDHPLIFTSFFMDEEKKEEEQVSAARTLEYIKKRITEPMTFEDLKKRAADERLPLFIGHVGSGGYDTTSIIKNEDGTCSVYCLDERNTELATWHHIPEDVACQMVYDAARSEKFLDEWRNSKKE